MTRRGKMEETKGEHKRFSKISFALAEKLPDIIKNKSDISTGTPIPKGLVAVKISIKSLPKYEVDVVGKSPTAYMKKLGLEEGISQKRLNKSLSGAFEE